MEEQLRRAAVEAVRSLGKRGRTSRVPETVRETVLAYVAAARAGGLEWREISQALGLSPGALRRWQLANSMKKRDNNGKPPRAFLPVVLHRSARTKATTTIATVSLTSPTGYRVEGLTARSAAELLRLLA